MNGLRYVFAPTTSIWKALNGEKLGRARKNSIGRNVVHLSLIDGQWNKKDANRKFM